MPKDIPVVVIGTGIAGHSVVSHLASIGEKKVLLVSGFEPESIPLKAFHIPEIIKPSRLTRKERRINERKNKKSKK